MLPHLYVLQYLKQRLAGLRANPDELEYLFCEFNSPILRSTYGPEYIAQAIEWFQNHEIYTMLGSRLNTDKVPSLCVTYEGGSETKQFLGDMGSSYLVDVAPPVYARFDIQNVISPNSLLLSGVTNARKKIWRGLTVENGAFSAKIQEIYPKGTDFEIVLSKPVSLAEVNLQNWVAKSSVDFKNRQLGSSLDSITIKVFLTIQGDPELHEAISMVIRYLMKQARMFLANHGLENAVNSHSAMGISSDHPETQVWVSEHTIQGLQVDTWILVETQSPDKMELRVKASEYPDTQIEDDVWLV